MGTGGRVAYVIGSFPVPSQRFILREILAVCSVGELVHRELDPGRNASRLLALFSGAPEPAA
jgi:hypothetical protein